MRLAATITIMGTALAMAGCNGGSDSQDNTASGSSSGTITVSSISANKLQYSQQTRFTVSGQGLDQGISLSASGCSNIVAVAGGTASQQVFTCNVSASGNWAAEVKASNGSVLLSASQTVPQPQVSMKTSMGDLVIELYPDKAPITVANFMSYVNSGFYSNLIFHRVVKEFVVQGGGYNASLEAKATQPPIKLEVNKGLSNLRGTIAMARTGTLDSATSQFYFNTVDNVGLDTNGGGYAVFGKIISGLTVIDQINLVPTSNSIPTTPVTINSVTQTQ